MGLRTPGPERSESVDVNLSPAALRFRIQAPDPLKVQRERERPGSTVSAVQPWAQNSFEPQLSHLCNGHFHHTCLYGSGCGGHRKFSPGPAWGKQAELTSAPPNSCPPRTRECDVIRNRGEESQGCHASQAGPGCLRPPRSRPPHSFPKEGTWAIASDSSAMMLMRCWAVGTFPDTWRQRAAASAGCGLSGREAEGADGGPPARSLLAAGSGSGFDLPSSPPSPLNLLLQICQQEMLQGQAQGQTNLHVST